MTTVDNDKTKAAETTFQTRLAALSGSQLTMKSIQSLLVQRGKDIAAAYSADPVTPPVVTPPVVVPPVTPPSGQTVSWEGLFAWDQTFGTTKSLLSQFGLSTPTAARPLICPLHLDRRSDWATAERIWFAADWKNSGPAYRKCVTVPGWPDGVSSSLRDVANGVHNQHYINIVKGVVAAFPGETHEYRFMHEADCCYNHKAINDPVSYVAGFDQFYTIAHQYDPGCIVVYCPLWGRNDIAYDGPMEPKRLDKYALDYYASVYNYKNAIDGDHGIGTLIARGQARGVPLGLYEFGPGQWIGQYASQTMPDDPAWVDSIRAAQKIHPIDIVNYIDDTTSGDPTGVRSDFHAHPKCLSRWIATSVTKAAA